MSNQTEGVIKYQLDYTPANALPWARLREINAWRQLMCQLSLIGQDPTRYGGFGYGNISHRLEPFDAPPAQRAFVISGSQTGGLPQLSAEHYTTVHQCHPAENRLVASGPVKPSSESLTHGAVYATSSQIGWVLHAHSPHIWRHAEALGLPITHASVPYGTPEMAAEVARLFAETSVAEQGIFSMGGHEDGIVAFGPTGAESFSVLATCLGRAMALD
jgi:ribulose-5-phosphate 4-epimerase/fuculose-1-phosphate aldolase